MISHTSCLPISRVGGNRSKERDRKSELVLRSTYQIFEWDRNNRDRIFDFLETNRITADRIFWKSIPANRSKGSNSIKQYLKTIQQSGVSKNDVYKDYITTKLRGCSGSTIKLSPFFSFIRYQGSPSSIKCHVYHHVRGERHTLVVCNERWEPILVTIAVDQSQTKTTNKLLIPATIPGDR